MSDRFRDQATVWLHENGIRFDDPRFDALRSALTAELHKTHDEAMADVGSFVAKRLGASK